MANEGYHEPISELSDETRDMHRAITSLMEELEAVDWYNQRVDAAKDPELAAILAHNRDEQKRARGDGARMDTSQGSIVWQGTERLPVYRQADRSQIALAGRAGAWQFQKLSHHQNLRAMKAPEKRSNFCLKNRKMTCTN